MKLTSKVFVSATLLLSLVGCVDKDSFFDRNKIDSTVEKTGTSNDESINIEVLSRKAKDNLKDESFIITDIKLTDDNVLVEHKDKISIIIEGSIIGSKERNIVDEVNQGIFDTLQENIAFIVFNWKNSEGKVVSYSYEVRNNNLITMSINDIEI